MKPRTTTTSRADLPEGYPEFIVSLKQRIRSAQVKAALSVNRELVLLYWQIGDDILTRQEREGWGAKVIDRLSSDLIIEFPEMKGFSVRNLKYMRKFAGAWRDKAIVQELLAQITWYHHIALLDKVKDPAEREWYIHETNRNGWSRNVLVHQIDSGLVNRAGASVTNFPTTLPAPQSELAREVIKDPYIFDFLGRSVEKSERELHQSLIEKLRDFLVELGIGFAFLGSEYHLEIGDQDFYIDLLFYHTRLHCYIIIELKIGAFVPEFAGKLNFYLSAADDLLRNPAIDNPCIGILLCREKNRVIAEYALRDMSKPMAISTYHIGPSLPPQFQEQLPDIARLKDLILKTTLDARAKPTLAEGLQPLLSVTPPNLKFSIAKDSRRPRTNHPSRYHKTNPVKQTTTHNDSEGGPTAPHGSSCKKESSATKKVRHAGKECSCCTFRVLPFRISRK